MSKSSLKHVVICGVSGAGKSTVARAIALEIDGQYADADDFHSDDAKQKMASGSPLTDEDRFPWLDRLSEYLNQADTPIVLACSALKSMYRERLNASGNVSFIVLNLSQEAAYKRVKQRSSEHFMPESLVNSQFAALEIAEDCSIVNAEQAIDGVVQDCLDIMKSE